jgi:hypothetical protein
MRMRLFGSTIRLPLAPPLRTSDPPLIAIPQQIVRTSQRMKFMASRIASAAYAPPPGVLM